MKRRITSIIVAAFFYTASLSAQTWEFKLVYLNEIGGTNQPKTSPNLDEFAEGLNAFGRDGWQLVTIDTFQGQKIAIFQRPAAK